MKTAYDILRQFVILLRSRQMGDYTFGPFKGAEDFKTGTVYIEFDSLNSLLNSAEEWMAANPLTQASKPKKKPHV